MARFALSAAFAVILRRFSDAARNFYTGSDKINSSVEISPDAVITDEKYRLDKLNSVLL
ncbi:secreted protein [Candidatus Magnetoovum chiemensis]|nr:secreted protein [Candidatus Magnetoovum chiemensis]